MLIFRIAYSGWLLRKYYKFIRARRKAIGYCVADEKIAMLCQRSAKSTKGMIAVHGCAHTRIRAHVLCRCASAARPHSIKFRLQIEGTRTTQGAIFCIVFCISPITACRTRTKMPRPRHVISALRLSFCLPSVPSTRRLNEGTSCREQLAS
eukprot:IDg1770t1